MKWRFFEQKAVKNRGSLPFWQGQVSVKCRNQFASVLGSGGLADSSFLACRYNFPSSETGFSSALQIIISLFSSRVYARPVGKWVAMPFSNFHFGRQSRLGWLFFFIIWFVLSFAEILLVFCWNFAEILLSKAFFAEILLKFVLFFAEILLKFVNLTFLLKISCFCNG